jgi:hypothetical protein
MADGSQRAFPFPRTPASRLRAGEIVVDLFAGGGGASTALEQALGRPVDVAIKRGAKTRIDLAIAELADDKLAELITSLRFNTKLEQSTLAKALREQRRRRRAAKAGQ